MKKYNFTYTLETSDNKIITDIVKASMMSRAKRVLKTRFVGCKVISLERNDFSYPFEHRERF